MKADEFVTEYKKNRKSPKFNIKPRTGHAPTQTGAGEHRDKKKEQKQGYEKHKSKSVSESTDIGQQMADDGVTYSPEKENEIIDLMAKYMQKAGMSSKQIRYLLSYDEDYVSDQLGFLPRKDMNERIRDPEDWDEGNTEPPNNFAVYINGKKWKVFKGRGQYADDQREKDHYRQLQNWAQQKSASTGKKWEVYITGEPATE
jgi:hypothetical protein